MNKNIKISKDEGPNKGKTKNLRPNMNVLFTKKGEEIDFSGKRVVILERLIDRLGRVKDGIKTTLGLDLSEPKNNEAFYDMLNKYQDMGVGVIVDYGYDIVEVRLYQDERAYNIDKARFNI